MLILLFGVNSQTLAQKRSEKEYEKIEKIITQGRIIHKERVTWFSDNTPKSSLNSNTGEATFWKIHNLYLLIDYKDKLYSCEASTGGFPSFIVRREWDRYHIFEKPEK